MNRFHQFRIIAAIALLFCGLLLIACDQDAEIKEIASHSIGHEPTDAEIRSACRALKSSGYDYYAAAPSRVVGQGSLVSIMAAITTVAGGGTQDYCEGKLKDG